MHCYNIRTVGIGITFSPSKLEDLGTMKTVKCPLELNFIHVLNYHMEKL